MGWTDPKLWTNGETLTAQDLNIYLRDNMLETEVAKARTPGALIGTDGANSIVERAWVMATTKTSSIETLAGDNPASAYHDLDTVGPVVTLETGTTVMAVMSVESSSNKDSTFADFAHEASCAIKVSGATTISALSSGSAMTNGQGNSATMQFSKIWFFDTLNPGTNTFTMQYRCFPDDNEASYQNRTLIIIPL